MATTTDTLFRVRLIGTRPLLISSNAGVAPRGPDGRRLKELMALRKRTEADNEEMQRLKYMFALYHDPKLGPYLPGYNLWAACRDAAAIHKMKTAWIRGVQVVEDKLPLQYDGPRDPDGLYEDPRFVDVRIARLGNGSSIEACRPIFPEWRLDATITVNDAAISVSDAKRAVFLAGSMTGVGTFRQRFGRFDMKIAVPNSAVVKAA
jgi:hypothetical protein